MKIYSPRGASVVVGNKRYSFAPIIPLDVPHSVGDYLISTRQFYKEGEIPEETSPTQDILKIGVYRIGGFGDALLGSCVITALQRKYPNARITAHTHSNVQKMWTGHPNIHHIDNTGVHRVNNIPKSSAMYDAYFDLMPDCYAHYRTNRIPQTTVIRHTRKREEIDRYKAIPGVLNHLKPFCKDKNFEALDVYNFLYDTDASLADMYIPQTPQDMDALKTFLPTLDKYITVHDWAFNGRQTKSWFVDYWERLVRLLKKEYALPIVQIGGAGEECLHADIDLRGKTSFGESAEILKHSSLHIDNESTPAHICAGVGTPCVVLCGSTLPYWRHRDNFNIVGKHACKECEGSPNWYNHCHDNGSLGCMRTITPDLVMEAIKKNPYCLRRINA